MATSLPRVPATGNARLNLPRGSEARTSKKGKHQTITYPCKSEFIDRWQAASPTISDLLAHLLGLLTVGKYKQIASSATNSQ